MLLTLITVLFSKYFSILSELDRNFSDILSPLLGFMIIFSLLGYILSATSLIFIRALEFTIYLPGFSFAVKVSVQ